MYGLWFKKKVCTPGIRLQPGRWKTPKLPKGGIQNVKVKDFLKFEEIKTLSKPSPKSNLWINLAANIQVSNIQKHYQSQRHCKRQRSLTMKQPILDQSPIIICLLRKLAAISAGIQPQLPDYHNL